MYLEISIFIFTDKILFNFVSITWIELAFVFRNLYFLMTLSLICHPGVLRWPLICFGSPESRQRLCKRRRSPKRWDKLRITQFPKDWPSFLCSNVKNVSQPPSFPEELPEFAWHSGTSFIWLRKDNESHRRPIQARDRATTSSEFLIFATSKLNKSKHSRPSVRLTLVRFWNPEGRGSHYFCFVFQFCRQ